MVKKMEGERRKKNKELRKGNNVEKVDIFIKKERDYIRETA